MPNPTRPTLAQLRAIAEAATQHRDAMHSDISACLEERSVGALAELARRATDNEFRRTQDLAALLDENERLRALLARRSAALGVVECKRAGCLASIDLPIIANSAWHVDDEGRWICPAHTKELSHAD